MSARPSSRLMPFLLFFVRQRWKGFVVMTLLPLFWAIEQNFFPYLTKLIIDTITTHEGSRAGIFSALAFPLLAGLGLWLLSALNWRILDLFDIYNIPQFQGAIRMAVVQYVLGHSHRYFADHFAGSIGNKIADIARSGWEVCVFITRRVFPTIMGVLIAIGLLLTVNPLFSTLMALFFISHMGICLLAAKKVNYYSVAHSEARSALQGKIVDVLTNILNVRLFARQPYEQVYLGTHQEDVTQKSKQVLWAVFKLKLLLELPSTLMLVGTVWGLIYGWQQGIISIGDFAYTISISFSIIHMTWWLGQDLPHLFREIGVCQQALALISHIHEVQDAEDATELEVTQGHIAFENVEFSYLPGKSLFRDKNVTIQSGQKVGLVGFSGSGKSTFVNLVLRYYDLDAGRILIDGQDIARVTQVSLRDQVAMIPQDTSLFHRTLMENIRYGRPDATDEEVIAASKQANAHEFIEKLEEGYNALVGERGIKLSGGQRQRIAIARAILKNAPILILDEATSALDSVTERYIQASFSELMQGKTTIVVAHRLSTLADMDRILVFQDGTITEDGTHTELLAHNGHYAYLWRMQAGGFLPEHETGDEGLG